jgi:mono/diheme cytochrome c family protein
MWGAHFAAVILALGFGCVSACAQQVVSVSVAGVTHGYTAADLLSRADVKTVSTDRDDAYHRSMTYRAIPLRSLLAGLNLDSEAYLEVVALDGYVSEIPVRLVLDDDPTRPTALLAVEDPAHPWPAIPGKSESAGPTYVIWIGNGAGTVRAGLWPYQAASISEVPSPIKRWPQLAVSALLSANDARRHGQDLFFAHCLVCHKVAGGGAAAVGPDLNLPMSPTEYFTANALQRYIRDPGSVRDWPDRRMPSFDSADLSDADIDLIIAYLRHKAETRRECPRGASC